MVLRAAASDAALLNVVPVISIMFAVADRAAPEGARSIEAAPLTIAWPSPHVSPASMEPLVHVDTVNWRISAFEPDPAL